MTERTVTEAQISLAIDKHLINCGPLKHKNDLLQYRQFFDELFPELPTHNELVKVWNGKVEPEKYEAWRRFKKISASGTVITYFGSEGQENQWDNYRRLTPAERGEG